MINNSLPRVTFFEISGKRALISINPRAPCRNAVEHKPCGFCIFWENKPDSEGMPFETALSRLGESSASRAELLIGGSVFDERQVPRPHLLYMLDSVSRISSVTHLLVETRPEFLTAEAVRAAVESARGKTLEIAMGLETADERVRDYMGKRFSIFDFYEAVKVISECGASPVAYLLAGYPNPATAHDDTLSSAYAMKSLGEKLGTRVRLVIETYIPPKLGHSMLVPAGTIAGIAKWIRMQMDMEVFVAVSAEGRTSHPLSESRADFERFNDTQDAKSLNRLVPGLPGARMR